MARLLCIGEVIVEMVAKAKGQDPLVPGDWVGPFPSGAPAILADQAALCGCDVMMAGTVGDDSFGQVCIDKLRADNVDTRLLRIDPDRTTGVAFVRYREDGSRVFIFHVAESASGSFELEDVGPALADIDCVHLMGSSAFSDKAVQVLVDVADAAAARGVKVSFDPNIRREMLAKPEFVNALRHVLNKADYVLASEGELPMLMGIEGDAPCAEKLLAGGAELVALKRGSKGSSLFLPGRGEIKAAPIAVKEIDATGAGDCFGGTFLSLLLQDFDPVEALELANRAGALSVTARGPMSGNRSLEDLVNA